MMLSFLDNTTIEIYMKFIGLSVFAGAQIRFGFPGNALQWQVMLRVKFANVRAKNNLVMGILLRKNTKDELLISYVKLVYLFSLTYV